MSQGCQVPATKTPSPNHRKDPKNVAGYSSREMGHQVFSGSNNYYHSGNSSENSHPKAEH
jgi:hypothetical protein